MVRLPGRGRGSRRTRAGLRAGGLLLVAAILLAVVLVSVSVGSKAIPIDVVWRAIVDNDGSYDAGVVWDQRMPRTLLGAAVGAALGVAGALMQALTRNPLADPGLLGVNAGASAAVVGSVLLFGLTDLSDYVWFAFGGAAIASVVVYVLGSAGRGGATPVRLALAGTVVTAVLSGLITAITTTDAKSWQLMRFWTIGSLVNRGVDVLLQVLPFVLIGLAIALVLTSSLNAISLGDQVGRALGAHVGRTRILAGLAVVLLCGGATAAAGPIVFVGLAVPHAVRAVVGPDYRWVVPYSMLVAPILLLGSDTLGRVILSSGELEVGVMTAIVGAPVFVYLVRRRQVTRL
ncbi:hypothetical protein CFN78_18495 [Amycolatopsis antarctica]|uniref:Fe(3+)-siderophore ABC transporter permease n=1 Tax=Amycolatopsis antarctica TaxID=1854586 RepID=A0A263D094_9PSEU|nr:hypothetical protein CFN78_18495 [Amycolatopsis antarctica]